MKSAACRKLEMLGRRTPAGAEGLSTRITSLINTPPIPVKNVNRGNVSYLLYALAQCNFRGGVVTT